MKNIILVGTYHKTGTHWMLDVFHQIASTLDVPFYHLSDETLGPTRDDAAGVVDI